MTDTNQRGKAHRHSRPMPSRTRFDEALGRWFIVPEVEFILPDNNTFGLLDLRSLVDEIGNEGED
jgi:hypothetical protein